MSAATDKGVLAVMDGYVGKVEEEWYETATDLREARATVAELIETQSETLRMLEAAHRTLGMWTDENPRILRARAALANAQGDAK